MSNIINQSFETPLGRVVCQLQSNLTTCDLVSEAEHENGRSSIFETAGHKIQLVSFKIRQPLYNGATVSDSAGWLWRIQKRSEVEETLTVRCVLTDHKEDITFGTAHGECLDAIEASNNDWVLHIGTEDGELLNSRAENDDWFPQRLTNLVEFYQSITNVLTGGLETRIPPLKPNEQIHIQYLTAFDKPDREGVSTWLAVDQEKRQLENWIGIF